MIPPVVSEETGQPRSDLPPRGEPVKIREYREHRDRGWRLDKDEAELLAAWDALVARPEPTPPRAELMECLTCHARFVGRAEYEEHLRIGHAAPPRAEQIALLRAVAELVRENESLGILYLGEQSAATLDAIAKEMEGQDAAVRENAGLPDGFAHPVASIPRADVLATLRLTRAALHATQLLLTDCAAVPIEGEGGKCARCGEPTELVCCNGNCPDYGAHDSFYGKKPGAALRSTPTREPTNG